MTYVLHKYYGKTGPPTETIAATNLKNAKIRAYRIAMRDKENLDRIGIETLAKSHNVYHAIKIFVRYADGKVWYTSGKTKKQLLSNGEFAKDLSRKKSEDIFAWYTGEKPKPKKTQKSQFVKDHIIIARPRPAGLTIKQFADKFDYYYQEMYKGRLDDSREWVDKGDALLSTKNKWAIELIKYRQDYISSDRESAAFARAYYYFKKKGLI